MMTTTMIEPLIKLTKYAKMYSPFLSRLRAWIEASKAWMKVGLTLFEIKFVRSLLSLDAMHCKQ